MALLDKAVENIIVYPEIAVISDDGDTITKASSVGIPAKATIQLSAQSGTSARRAEQGNEGFESEDNYRMRFSRAEDARIGLLGPQAAIEWNGYRWEVYGYPKIYRGSARTAHVDYTIRRA